MGTDTTAKPPRTSSGDVQKESGETVSDRAYPLHRSREEMGTHGGHGHRTPDSPPPERKE